MFQSVHCRKRRSTCMGERVCMYVVYVGLDWCTFDILTPYWKLDCCHKAVKCFYEIVRLCGGVHVCISQSLARLHTHTHTHSTRPPNKCKKNCIVFLYAIRQMHTDRHTHTEAQRKQAHNTMTRVDG